MVPKAIFKSISIYAIVAFNFMTRYCLLLFTYVRLFSLSMRFVQYTEACYVSAVYSYLLPSWSRPNRHSIGSRFITSHALVRYRSLTFCFFMLTLTFTVSSSPSLPLDKSSVKLDDTGTSFSADLHSSSPEPPSCTPSLNLRRLRT